MAEDIQEFFKTLLPTVDGLEGILVTDRDGIPIVKSTMTSIPLPATKPGFLATFSLASEQGGKLGLSHNTAIVSMYSGHQLVQFNHHPLMVTLIARDTANTGSLMGLENEILAAIKDLKIAVET
ncbi:ragulator complex protein LAMTOR3-like [Oscarella lobularis]|uniref:ragulator complex protein LAMTOR3-like n=1 Tax=Oscarella lobularis TaxID=121494 RepID=UPI003313D8BE